MSVCKMGVEFMTELIIKEVKNKGVCIVDNHTGKTGKSYTRLVSNLTPEAAEKYMIMKGIG